MPKYKITNTSPASEKGARNVFLTEAGRLLKPGEHCVVNRVDSGTLAQAEAGLLRVEEGSFAAPPIFPEEPLAPAPSPPAVVHEVTPEVTNLEEPASTPQTDEAAPPSEEASAEEAPATTDAPAPTGEDTVDETPRASRRRKRGRKG